MTLLINTYHRTIKMKPVDVKDDFFAEYNVKSNEKYPQFKIGDHVRTSKYKNIFAKGYADMHLIVLKKSLLLKNTKYCTLDICN